MHTGDPCHRSQEVADGSVTSADRAIQDRSRLLTAEIAPRVQLVFMPKRSVVKRTALSATIALHID
jgi:hypothetical protein